MAPTAPSKRKSLRQKASSRTDNKPTTLSTTKPTLDSLALSAKKTDKRTVKRAVLLSRVAKSTPTSSTARRRRSVLSAAGGAGVGGVLLPPPPSAIAAQNRRKRQNAQSKKKIASLESLVAALPELTPEEDGNVEELRKGKVRMKSLKSSRGALKRKNRVVKGEMERFGNSLAQLSALEGARSNSSSGGGSSSSGGGGGSGEGGCDSGVAPAAMDEGTAGNTSNTSNRWAALRGFISTTLEQNPAFTKQNTTIS